MSDPEFKKKMKTAAEIAKLAPGVNAFLGRMAQASKPNREQARAMGFPNAAELLNQQRREQVRQGVIEERKTEIIDKWFFEQLRHLLPLWLITWAGKARWRMRVLGVRLGVGDGWSKEHDCPTSICRVWRFGKEIAAVEMIWGNDEKA